MSENDIKLLFGIKGEVICNRFFSATRRFPTLFQKNRLKELAFFLSNCPQAFLESREESTLRQILFCHFRSIKEADLESSEKEKIKVKVLERNQAVYGLFLSFFSSENKEFFNEDFLVKGAQQLIPAIKPLAHSFLSLRRGSIFSYYLEIKKVRGGYFTPQEKEKLSHELPAVFQKTMDPRALFFPGIEEALFKNINQLGQELKTVQDLPQVMLSFIEYYKKTVKFLAVVLRVVKPESPSIEMLSSHLSSLVRLTLENVFCLGLLRKKYRKEAAILSLEIDCTHFLNSGKGLNLKAARQYAAKELEGMLGPFRDYNGGLLTKENEQLAHTKRILKGNDFPFLEDFFDNLKPLSMKALIFPKTAEEFVSLIKKTFEKPLIFGKKYDLEYHHSHEVHLVIIKTKEQEWKRILPKAVLRQAPHSGTSFIEYEGFLYLSFFQQFPENDSLLNIVKKEILEILSTTSRRKENILYLNFQSGDPPTLNPRLTHDIQCHTLANLLFEGLMCITDQGKVIPAAAEKIDISSCKRHYTFHLRECYWSNGEELTAYHFEQAWKKAITAESRYRIYLNYYSVIKNVRGVIEKEIPIEKVGISALNSKTLAIELEAPCAYFLNLVASPPFFPLYANFEEPFCFNGPYMLSEWKRDCFLYLSKNPFYRNATQVKLSGLKILMERDPKKIYKMFQKEELDLIGDPFSPLPSTILKEADLKGNLITQGISRVFWIHCNLTTHPLHNAKIRRALYLALNREFFAQNVFFKQTPHASPLPAKYSMAHESVKERVDEARQTFSKGLAELNISKASFPALTFTTSDFCYEKSLFKELKRQWQNVLGITVLPNHLPWSEFSASLEKKNYQLCGLFRRDTYSNPFSYLSFFKKGTYNPHGWESQEYEKLLERCFDEKNQNKAIAELEAFLIAEAPVIPLVNQNYHFLINRRVKGIKFNENGCLNLTETKIDYDV